MIDRNDRNKLIKMLESLAHATQPLPEIVIGLKNEFQQTEDKTVAYIVEELVLEFGDAEDLYPDFYKYYFDYLERWHLLLLSDGELFIVKKMRNMYPRLHVLSMAIVLIILCGTWLFCGYSWIVGWVWLIGWSMKFMFGFKTFPVEKPTDNLTPFKSYSQVSVLVRKTGFRKKHKKTYPCSLINRENGLATPPVLKRLGSILLAGLIWPLMAFLMIIIWVTGESVYDVKLPEAR